LALQLRADDFAS